MGAKIMATIEDKNTSTNAKVQFYFLHDIHYEKFVPVCKMRICCPVVLKYFLSIVKFATYACHSLAPIFFDEKMSARRSLDETRNL